jgi:hypothetical protein
MIHYTPEDKRVHDDQQSYLRSIPPKIGLREEIELAKWLEQQEQEKKPQAQEIIP